MLQRFLVFAALVILSEAALFFIHLRLQLPLPGLLVAGITAPILILIPVVQLAPRHCSICGKRTRRPVPFFQAFKEFFRIGGVGFRCSLHSR